MGTARAGGTGGTGGTVVTGNQRAARELRRAFDRKKRAEGATVWEPGEVLSWESWTASLWRGLLLDGQVTGMLLNRSQELLLWRSIVGEDVSRAGEDAAGVSEAVRGELAGMAAEAWALLEDYGGSARLRSYEGNTDTAAFARWARTFERRCRVEGYVSRSSIEATLRPEVEAGRARLPVGGIELVGFDEMLPARRSLLEAMERSGMAVVERVPERVEGEGFLALAEDEGEELRSCALWVRRLLERKPGARVGVIVPKLEGRREEIERSFRRVLAPELESLTVGADAVGPYEFSLGVALRKTPAGGTALGLLRWAAGPLELERVSALLRSPYVGGAAGIAAEGYARASFDVFRLRMGERLRPEIGVAELLRLARGSRWGERMPVLGEVLGRFAAVAGRCGAGEIDGYAGWAEAMRELLGAARWSEGGGGGSVAFQMVRKWESALDELGTMDFAGGTVGYAEALAELERIAGETIFAPESRDAPVQVMGPMEAAGSSFDAVWVLGAGDGSWPPAVASHPLLPWGLRRDLGMPGTEVTADAERGRALTERIRASARTVVFSYARETAEGPARASAALEEMRLRRVDASELGGASDETVRVALERVEDVEPVPVPPDAVIRGGAKVLELQAACGFRAFAELRLAGGAPETPDLGWDSRKRGVLVHRVLELFWSEVRTQDELREMTREQREACLLRHIDAAVGSPEKAVVKGGAAGEPARRETGAWDAAYVGVQRERLRRLLLEWLEIEAARSRFEVKLSEEEQPDVAVGPLRLGVRVDRVDRTDHGEVLIDYKTGVAKASGWVGERPDQPQLPLYAILSGAERLGGVAFGVVRPGKEMGLEGYADDANALTRRVEHGFESFGAQVEEWRSILTGLAEDFYHGDTRVKPKSYPQTCQRCEARILCRLDPAAMVMDRELDGSVDGSVDGERDEAEQGENDLG